MKPSLLSTLCLFCFTAFTTSLNSQITVNQNDFPSAGDTLRYSVASNVFLLQPGNSGANQTWNFNQLTSASQYLEEFKPMNQAELFYQFAFTASQYPASYFKPESNAIALPPQAGITVSEQMNFYRKSSNYFMQTGIGAKLNGFPVPIPYEAPDKIYQFPLTYQRRDTVPFQFNIGIPGLGYYGKNAIRKSHVDGHGTLTTPFGTFNCLRIKSIIDARDSIYLDTLGFGFGLNLPTEIHYTWIAQGEKYPLMDMTVNVIPVVNLEQVTRVVYRDKFILVASLDEAQNSNDRLILFPNPAKEELTINGQNFDHIVLINSSGQLVNQFFTSNATISNQTIQIDLRSLSAGFYFVMAYQNGVLNRIEKLCKE